MHLRNVFQPIHSAPSQILFLEQPKLERQQGIAVSEISYSSMYQIITEGGLCFLTQNFQIRRDNIFWNPVSHNFVRATITLNKEIPNQ